MGCCSSKTSKYTDADLPEHDGFTFHVLRSQDEAEAVELATRSFLGSDGGAAGLSPSSLLDMRRSMVGFGVAGEGVAASASAASASPKTCFDILRMSDGRGAGEGGAAPAAASPNTFADILRIRDGRAGDCGASAASPSPASTATAPAGIAGRLERVRGDRDGAGGG